MKMKVYIPIVLVLIFTACEVINPDEDIPSFISINEFEHTEVGTAKIVDAWVYIDNDLQGIYPLPNIIPVLKNGEQKRYIAPGIKENGISATRTNYPFYVWHQEDVILSPQILLISIQALAIFLIVFNGRKILMEQDLLFIKTYMNMV